MEMPRADQGCFFHDSVYADRDGEHHPAKVPVVQELVRIGLDHVPQNFKLPDNQIVRASHEAMIPIISLAKLGDDVELEKLHRGAEEWGMFLVTDHGIEEWVMKRVMEVVKGFFDLSFEEKKANVRTSNSVDNMGYGRNFLKLGKPVDWIDRLSMKAAPAEAVDVSVWPLRPPSFRKAMETYVNEARKVLNLILKHLARAFGLEEDAFMRNFDPANKTEINIRINYYPPCPAPESVLGITPHTDASGLTLLMQSEASGGGLQVMDTRSKDWFSVHWPKDTLLVSTGDLMDIMSNGRVQSPWHRVAAQEDAERFSTALFYNPPAEFEIGPACQEGDAKYRKVLVKDYLQHFYDISPTEDKQAIMYAKLHH